MITSSKHLVRVLYVRLEDETEMVVGGAVQRS
jgi:hypothetical protein